MVWTGLLPCVSWGHCIWVTVLLWVMGRSSSRWGPHVTFAVVLGSSRAGPRLLKCWQLQTKIWKAKQGEWEGGRERLQRTLHGEKKEREQKEREPEASKSCPVVIAMPRAKQAFYQFLGFRFILVLWVFLPHKSVHDSSCEKRSSVWSICWRTGSLIQVEPRALILKRISM